MIYINNINLMVIFILLLVIFLSFFINKISKLLNLYDNPNSNRKIHNEPTSIINGLFILLALNIYFLFDIFIFSEFSTKYSFIFIILINSFYIVGYIDDIKNLSPKLKTILITGILLIILPLDQNLILKYLKFKNLFNTEIYLYQASIFITVFFIYIFYNFLNFIDGINGVAISITSYFILVLGFERGYFLSIEILLLLVLLYCLILNMQNKSFLGNSGISVLGVFIPVFYISEYNLKQTLLCDEIFIIFFIPGIDMTRLVISRIRSGKSISDSDLNHLHHKFLYVFNKKFIFLFYSFFSIIPYFLTFILKDYLITIIISLIIYVTTIYGLNLFPKNINTRS